VTGSASKSPPRYVGAVGGGLFELGSDCVTSTELRKRADVLDAIAKAARGVEVVGTDARHSLAELQSLAKAMTRAEPRRVLSVLDTPGAAEALEKGGAHVWRVRGAEGTVFASRGAPAFSELVVPVSKHGDFAAKPTRKVRLLRKDAGVDPSEILPEAQIVYGIVLEPEVVDSQGDIYDAGEIERACHLYLENFQTVGHMHQTMLSGESAKIVESYIAPCDFSMGGQAVKLGTWVMAIHILSPDLWAQIKAGELTGFSIGGWAQRVPTTPATTPGA
jgi:Putative phage serine protease XkdF